MGDILLIGNGFDLAHGLPTSYNEFLFLMKNWSSFHAKFSSVRQGHIINENDTFYKYVVNAKNMDEKNIQILGDIINHNSWAKYYCQCEAEIDGWIDFEREIYPVMNLMEIIFNTIYETSSSGSHNDEAHIIKSQLRPEILRIASLWDKFFNTSGNNAITVKAPYASIRYGILKKQIIKSLREDFNEFINALELYMLEFVHKRTDVKLLEQIKKLTIEYVISFNYTLTERIYGIDNKKVHHIHGMIREDLTSGTNNMVVGVNEQEHQNMDFIYFVKYFQRIQKASGVKYKKFVNSYIQNVYGRIVKEAYNLHIYGHSLDETDEDILKYVIGDKTEKEKLNLNPTIVFIYYYDSKDYEQKVINLIKLYGRTIVEEYMEKEKFKFIPTDSKIWN